MGIKTVWRLIWSKIAGGSGGGRPDSAMAGGKDITKVDEALNVVDDVLKNQLEK